MPAQPTAIGAGLVALDLIVADAKSPKTTRIQAGGSCGNVMAILASLGWRAAPVARLDKSKNTQLLMDDLEHWNVDCEWAKGEESGSTPVILQVNHDPGTAAARHKFHWRCRDCAGWYPRFKPFVKATAKRVAAKETNPKAFYFDRAFPASLELATAMRAAGAAVVFEPNSVRDEKHFRQALKLAHVVKYSHERVAPHADLIAEPGAWLQIETMGREGLRFALDGKKWEHLPAIEAPYVVDTAGAGDWCSAILIDQLFRSGAKGISKATKSHVKKALVLGQAHAALNCAFPGARGAMFSLTNGQIADYADALVEGHVEKIPPKDLVGSTLQAYCGTCQDAPRAIIPARR